MGTEDTDGMEDPEDMEYTDDIKNTDDMEIAEDKKKIIFIIVMLRNIKYCNNTNKIVMLRCCFVII